MPASFQEVLQEFKDAEEPEQLEQWRQGGHAARKVKMLQQRARSIAEDWLEYYRKATGTSFLSSGSGLGLIHPNVMFFSPRVLQGLSGWGRGDHHRDHRVFGGVSFQDSSLLT